MDSDPNDVRPASRPFRRTLGLVFLFTLPVLAAGVIAWLAQPSPVVATALFQVQSTAVDTHGGTAGRPMDVPEFDILKKTQVALLKSNFVLTAALRNPKIGSLSIFHGLKDPVAWLQEHLVVEYPHNGQLLSISLEGPKAKSQDLRDVVDAVALAYKNEVISDMRQERLASRDLLARNLDNLNKEIKERLDTYLDIARESGGLEGGGGQVLQQLDTKRLDRIEEELMRLESELASDGDLTDAKAKLVGQRINQLQERQTGLEKKLMARAEKSADLEARHTELAQLQSIANDLSARLEWCDIEANNPDRIRQVQSAVIEPQRSLVSQPASGADQLANTDAELQHLRNAQR